MGNYFLWCSGIENGSERVTLPLERNVFQVKCIKIKDFMTKIKIISRNV